LERDNKIKEFLEEIIKDYIHHQELIDYYKNKLKKIL
jgi:hypothetical protein